MHISEKINLKKYAALSFALLILTYFLANDVPELRVMLTIFTAACLNHWMLIRGVQVLTSSALGKRRAGKWELLGLFVGKAIVLIVALTFGVQIMGKRIIIPLLIYVLQIGVLYFSFKRIKVVDESLKSE